MAVQDFSSLPLYSTNTDLTYLQDNIPLPDNKENLPYAYKTYEDVDEPIFDPSIHLDLQMPDSVKTLPHYQQAGKGTDGNLAYSKPFQFLSAKGLAVIRKIVNNCEEVELVSVTCTTLHPGSGTYKTVLKCWTMCPTL